MARRTKQGADRRQAAEPYAQPEPSAAADAPAQVDRSHGDMLLHWVVQGYEIGQLVGDLRGKEDVEPYFAEYRRRVARSGELVAEMESLGTVPPERMEKLRAASKDPARLAELEKELVDQKLGPRIKELKAEFLSLNVRGFEEAARAIQAKFADPSRLDEIEKDIRDLKHKVKERFFEQEFAVHLEPVPESGAQPVAETIFIVHRDGTLLSVKSKQSKEKVDKQALIRIVNEIRDRIGKGSADSFAVDDLKVVMENGRHVCVAVAFTGDEIPIMRKVIDKVVQIMEHKNSGAFGSWSGDRSALVDMERYPAALFQALEQMKKS